MKTTTSKVAMLCLAGTLLTGCESVKEMASKSGDTIEGWFGGSDRSYIAQQVGSDLNDDDAMAIEKASARALEWTPAGKSVTWSNPKTGTRAVIVPGKKEMAKRKIQTARMKGVAPAPNMELIAQIWSAQRNANLRSAPGTHGAIVGGLAKGERFTAIGKVDGGKWIMVGMNGKAIGYVFAKLVGPHKAKDAPVLRAEELELDGDSLGRDVVVDTMTVAAACRTVNYTVITGDNEQAKERFRACKAGDGAWEIN
jgi:surface antigen